MTLSDIFFAILYGTAFILIIYFIFGLFHKASPQTVVIYQDETPVYQESVWWPWSGSSYNYWPYWGGWYSGGGDGGYGRGYHGRRWGAAGRPWGGAGRGGNRGGFGRRGGRGGR